MLSVPRPGLVLPARVRSSHLHCNLTSKSFVRAALCHDNEDSSRALKHVLRCAVTFSCSLRGYCDTAAKRSRGTAEEIMETALTLMRRSVYRVSYKCRIFAIEMAEWMHISRAWLYPGPFGGWGCRWLFDIHGRCA